MNASPRPDGASRSARVAAGTRAAPALVGALMDFAAAAVRNDRVDPITTELVRLRCATAHDCRT
ncbi:MAG: hypothetical protein ACE37B_23280 [Ilumatobacter sp.]|uniref:hypothetical protein n=1 Tax=Ilumatobacter sp. TaxID=1967498 RepID=UPI0039198D8B